MTKLSVEANRPTDSPFRDCGGLPFVNTRSPTARLRWSGVKGKDPPPAGGDTERVPSSSERGGLVCGETTNLKAQFGGGDIVWRPDFHLRPPRVQVPTPPPFCRTFCPTKILVRHLGATLQTKSVTPNLDSRFSVTNFESPTNPEHPGLPRLAGDRANGLCSQVHNPP
jgi:hypothetical protein